ncbi:hypothetical protein KX816_13390 [Sphingosinicellaceae bacterium]|nr:hypothetical protein KX816_13390 [Sphingosinicellaceae bacterium]
MTSNLERFIKDLDSLSFQGEQLAFAMSLEVQGDHMRQQIRKQLKEKADSFIKGLPKFDASYQHWYSESLAVIRQLLPDRLEDFKRLYEKPKAKRELSVDTYVIQDYLQGLTASRSGQKIVGPNTAIALFDQQVAILKSAQKRFESSLFDIRSLVQADLLDSEISIARELLKNKFTRAAGAIAGVILEKHLLEISDNHKIVIKKNAGIALLNQGLKDANVIDIPQWRKIQHLTDIRNLCDHARTADPTVEQVADLIDGVDQVIKTLF